MQCSTVQCSAVQCSPVQCSKVQQAKLTNIRILWKLPSKGEVICCNLWQSWQSKVAEDEIEQLKASEKKLLDARLEMRQLDKKIQNIHMLLGEEETADQYFIDTDNTCASEMHLVFWDK